MAEEDVKPQYNIRELEKIPGNEQIATFHGVVGSYLIWGSKVNFVIALWVFGAYV